MLDKIDIAEYSGADINYYQDKKLDTLLLIWTDQNAKFHWEDNFEEKYRYIQALLDRNVDFKF
ncbi:hypothetical protein ABE426_18890 [Sphingobacterium faecium]|uniref:hypothetical protein n=1 Tax=Sphingobacterium faecium TaxID=34087 RepID=UPI00320B71C8